MHDAITRHVRDTTFSLGDVGAPFSTRRLQLLLLAAGCAGLALSFVAGMLS